MDYAKTAEQLTPVQFELLLRAYVLRQARRVRDASDTCRDLSIDLDVVVDDKGVVEFAKWSVCLRWEEVTKGEILDGAVTEMLRRQGWARTPEATLRQIEGSVG